MECWPFCNWWLLMMIAILVLRSTEGGYIEEERRSLLDIKMSLIDLYDSEPKDPLPTWIDNGSDSKCCEWERVKCNTTTGHVIEISLFDLTGISDSIDRMNWPLNVSLFLHFEELTSLNLSSNYLDGGVLKTELEKLSNLKKLEILGLSLIYDIDNSILPLLGALTSLRILDLSRNNLWGYFPANGKFYSVSINSLILVIMQYACSEDAYNLLTYIAEFAALENLEVLDLTYCLFHGFERVPILRKLEILNLAYNKFNDSVITSLSDLPSLKALDLHGTSLSRSFPAEELSHLTNMEKLDLSFTRLSGTPNIQACKSLSRLRRLEDIALLNNNFNKSIISCLSALPSLKILDLSYSASLGSSFPAQEFSNLRGLEVLFLRGNRFNGTLPMEALASIHHLEVLDLSHNSFVGSIPPELQALSSLRVVSFADNDLNGSLPNHGFCEMKNLHELDLSHNMLEGSLPQCFNSLSSLKIFDISSNQFTGILPLSLIANLTSLEYIDFSHNKFEGSLSFSSFYNHTKLEVVQFRSDNDKFEVDTEEPIGWIPMFQLEVLVLSNCNINIRKGRAVPGFLVHQHKLRVVEMSHTSLEGHFPNWLIKNNTNLEFIILRNNSFGGSILMPLYRNDMMRGLDFSRNHMTGTIPDDIQKSCPNINSLNFSKNGLSGDIPSSIGDLSELRVLDLSDNKLSGEVPKGLFTNLSRLNILKLSENKLHGQVLSGNLSWGNIEMAYLDINHFTGKIGTKSKGKLAHLSVLDISNNFFTGVIPNWISNMSWLSELVVRNNSFKGRFPCGIAPFSFLDISQNSFSGPIPSCLNLEDMEHLHLSTNRFTGLIPNSFHNLTKALTLDIGNNNLSGKIPRFLGELSDLRILLLRNNNFSGSIPQQLCQLSNMGLMDLSHNSLSGSIPSCLQNMTGPSYLAFIQHTISWHPIYSSYDSGSVLWRLHSIDISSEGVDKQDEVQFTTKSLSLPYKGGILNYMSGLDLSCNKLTGEIPEELGLLIQIRALNLSHNQLTGPIPVNFSNLANIESLDLSSNGLTGKVPSELIKLTSLSTFNVSHNHLSGRLPEMKAQFSTFTEKSYEGNPLLCGSPLEKKCSGTDSQVTNPSAEEDNEKWYDIDMTCFYASSGSTCVLFLLGFAAFFYTNPQWRRRWLDWVEDYMFTCYYFLYDLVTRPSVIFCR